MSTAYYGRAVPLALRRFAAWLREEGRLRLACSGEKSKHLKMWLSFFKPLLSGRRYKKENLQVVACDIPVHLGYRAQFRLNAVPCEAKYLHVEFWILVRYHENIHALFRYLTSCSRSGKCKCLQLELLELRTEKPVVVGKSSVASACLAYAIGRNLVVAAFLLTTQQQRSLV